jgi:phosphohistidine swiveling domain-containing protein
MNWSRIITTSYAAIIGGVVDWPLVTAKKAARFLDGNQFVVVHKKKPRCNRVIDAARLGTALRCLKLN